MQIGADAENEDNVAEQKRQQGKKVLYGQIIQVCTGRKVLCDQTIQLCPMLCGLYVPIIHVGLSMG